jgi:hypothetical protein
MAYSHNMILWMSARSTLDLFRSYRRSNLSAINAGLGTNIMGSFVVKSNARMLKII